jgi:hypothetical protein
MAQQDNLNGYSSMVFGHGECANAELSQSQTSLSEWTRPEVELLVFERLFK